MERPDRIAGGRRLATFAAFIVLAACAGPMKTSPAKTSRAGPEPVRTATKTLDHGGNPLLIENGTVLDPVTRTATKRHIVIEDGRIKALTEKPPAAFEGRRFDATGRFIVPAFADMHVHAWGNPSPLDGPDHVCGIGETARFMLYCGVVAFLDLGSNEERIFGFRDRQRAQGRPGADLYAAGAVIGHIADPKKRARTAGDRSADGPQRFRAAQTPTDGRRHVEALAKLRADVVKVLYDHTGSYMNMPRDVLAAIVDEAHRRKLKVVVHIGTWKDAADAVAVGADAITHLWDEDNITPALVAAWKRKGVRSIPTQPVQVDLPNVLAKPGVLAHPLLQAVTTPKLRADYRKTKGFVPKAAFWMKYQGPHTGDYARQLAVLHKGGVALMTGSDSGNFGVFQGFSLHREMALFGAAGIPTWAILHAASIEPGRFLGRKFGTQVGDEASLVILARDPIATIDATTSIVAVIHRGRVVDRNALLQGTTVAPAKPVPSAATR